MCSDPCENCCANENGECAFGWEPFECGQGDSWKIIFIKKIWLF